MCPREQSLGRGSKAALERSYQSTCKHSAFSNFTHFLTDDVAAGIWEIKCILNQKLLFPKIKY